MLQTICSGCSFGDHNLHREIIQAPPPGMLGGYGCRCKGECVDGRYMSNKYPNLKRFLQEVYVKQHEVPDNIVLGEN